MKEGRAEDAESCSGAGWMGGARLGQSNRETRWAVQWMPAGGVVVWRFGARLVLTD